MIRRSVFGTHAYFGRHGKKDYLTSLDGYRAFPSNGKGLIRTSLGSEATHRFRACPSLSHSDKATVSNAKNMGIFWGDICGGL
jgi:hypothetical protein